MSMRDLKDINELREIVNNLECYPKLVIILLKQRCDTILDNLKGINVSIDTIEELERISEKLKEHIK